MTRVTSPHTPAAESVPRPPRHILLVDDEPAVLFAYCKMIQREGIRVDQCQCLDTALACLGRTPYLAVIADLRLAGTDNRDGLELVRAVRSAQPASRIILATGYGSPEVERTARNMGVAHYFEKPVHPSEILNTLKDLLEPDGQPLPE